MIVPQGLMAQNSLDFDVVVCGGGLAGAMAAVAAARGGAKTLIIERYGFLGGNATAGAVAQFNCWQTPAGRRVIGGLANEVVERLRSHGGARPHQTFTMSNGHRMDRVEYAPELLKVVLDEMICDAGVEPLLHSVLIDVDASGRRVRSLTVHCKAGLCSIRPRILVDASGDIDAMHRAGARFLQLDEGESLQPATMMFRFGPIDFDRFEAIKPDESSALASRGYSIGALARAALTASRDPFALDAWFNVGRLEVDATDPLALGRAEIEGRRQAMRAAKFLTDEVPGCGQGRLISFATQIGIRETRRIEGDHVLTADELRRSEPFADAIAQGAYPIDIHPVVGGGLHYEHLGDDHSYRIPYRSLVPSVFDNALVAGRGISATHEALAAIRVMPISMAVGQAVGTAAAMAVRSKTNPGDVRAVDPDHLKQRLIADSACLD